MSTTSFTSEIEAINTMLDAIGESPVSSLEVSGLVDVAKARAVLNEVSRELQSLGWTFNTEKEYPLVRQDDGTITVPENFIAVDSSRLLPSIDVVQRGQRLYDKKAHSYSFTKDITADVTILLPWEELPQTARTFIAIRAARVFQSRVLGSDSLHRFSAEQEQSAWEALQAVEAEAGDYNIFSGSSSVAQILER